MAKNAQLMAHMRLVHADNPNFVIHCNRQGCRRTFRNFSVYKNHIYTFHDDSEEHTMDEDQKEPSNDTEMDSCSTDDEPENVTLGKFAIITRCSF